MEPIEIELRMKQNLEEESKKAQQGIDGLATAAERSQAEVRQNIAIQKKVITELKNELKPLEAAFKKVNVSTQDPKVYAERKKLSGVIKQMTADLNAEEKTLVMLEKRLETTGKKMSSLRTQTMNVRDEMGALRLAGQKNTEAYRELEEQLGRLGTAHRELRAIEKAVSTGGTQLAGFMDGLNILSGSISAGSGAIALFNGDSEKMAEIQTKLQGVMAISIGLMQLSNALHSTSAFRITTVTKVKEVWIAINNRLAASLWKSKIAATALMGALTLGLSVAIGAAIYFIDKYISKQRKAAEETKKFNGIVNDSAAEQLVSYHKLKKSFQALNGDIEKQTQFVKDNEKEFEKLGLSVDEVNKAEKIFSEQGTAAFTAAVMERAKAVASMELAAEKYKTYLVKLAEADAREKTPTALDKTASSKDWYWRDGKNILLYDRAVQEANKMREDAKITLKEFSNFVDDYVKAEENANKKLNGLGGTNKPIADYTKAYWEKRKADATEELAKMRDHEKGSAAWNKELAKYREAEEKLNAWSFNRDKKESTTKTDEKEREALIAKQKELETATQKARVAAMKEGIEKTLAENEMSHQARLEQIERQKTELINSMRELEKATWEASGGKGTFKSKIDELPKELNELFIAQTEDSLKQLENANGEAINKLINSSEINKSDTSAVIKAIANTQREKLNTIGLYESLQLKELAKQEQKLDAQTYQKKVELIKKEAKAAREAIQQEADDALKAIPKDMLNDLFGEFDLSFMNLDHATLGQLNKVADKLQKLSLDKGKLLELGITEAQITMLQSLLADLKNEGASNIQTARLSKISEAFGEIGSLMSKAGDDLTRAVGEMVSGLGQMITTLNDSNASGFQKATSIVSLAITAGNQLAKIRQDINSKEVDAQKFLNKQLASQLSIEREINKIRRERAEIDRNSSAFLSPDAKKEYKASLDAVKESEKMMNDSLGSLMNNAVFSAEGSAKRRLFGTKTGTYDFSMAQLMGEYKEKYVGEGIADLFLGQHNQIQGGFMSFIGGMLDPLGIFGGYADGKAEQNAFKNLGNAFDSTLKSMGKTSADIAKMSSQEWVDFFTLMETGGYITDQGTKEMIANAKAATEEYAAAMEDMKKIISDVAGSLGSQLTNDLVTAFKAGEDAAMAFKKSVNDVLQSMFMQSIETAFFRKHFDKLQKDMNASIDGGDGEWEDDLMSFFDNIEPAIGKAQQAMEVWDKKMTAAGYDGFKGGEDSDTRSGKTKGIAQASQESIDELNGRIMAISGNVYKINEGNIQLLGIERESLLVSRIITAQLDVIADNTAYCRFLVDIDNTLEEIKVKGVKIR